MCEKCITIGKNHFKSNKGNPWWSFTSWVHTECHKQPRQPMASSSTHSIRIISRHQHQPMVSTSTHGININPWHLHQYMVSTLTHGININPWHKNHTMASISTGTNTGIKSNYWNVIAGFTPPLPHTSFVTAPDAVLWSLHLSKREFIFYFISPTFPISYVNFHVAACNQELDNLDHFHTNYVVF